MECYKEFFFLDEKQRGLIYTGEIDAVLRDLFF